MPTRDLEANEPVSSISMYKGEPRACIVLMLATAPNHAMHRSTAQTLQKLTTKSNNTLKRRQQQKPTPTDAYQ